jgi:hypothetical protein
VVLDGEEMLEIRFLIKHGVVFLTTREGRGGGGGQGERKQGRGWVNGRRTERRQGQGGRTVR